MSKMLDVVRGISQALSQKYDGAVDPKTGEKVKIGLQREADIPHTERPIMDGFSVVFYGDKLCIKYQSEVMLKEVLEEADILMQSMNKHRNWVQCSKHYKIGNIKGEANPYTGKEDLTRDATKKFLALGKNNTPY